MLTYNLNSYKLGIERSILNLLQGKCEKTIGKILLIGEIVSVLPIRPEIINECPLLQLLFNTVMEVLVNAIR